jgi:hypothetical protein
VLFWDVVRQFNAVVGPSYLGIVLIATLVNSQVACEIAGSDHVYILSEDLLTRYLRAPIGCYQYCSLQRLTHAYLGLSTYWPADERRPPFSGRN